MLSIRANGGHYLSYSLAESPSGELRYQSREMAALAFILTQQNGPGIFRRAIDGGSSMSAVNFSKW